QIQQMAQDVRFLQWKSAQEATKALLLSRNTMVARLSYYQRLLGLQRDQNAPDNVTLDGLGNLQWTELTEENFDEAYSALVSQYDKALTLQNLPALNIAEDTSPAQQSGASGPGKLYLNVTEDSELNVHLPQARDARLSASAANLVASSVNF